MNKFKVGDKVRVKSSDGYTTSTSVYKIGDIGVITDISDRPAYKTARYKLDNEYGGWVNEEDLELLKGTINQQVTDLQKDFVCRMGAIGKLISKDQVDKLVKEKEEELKTRYNKAIFNLNDSLNEKNDLLDWADKQLDGMANQIEKKDEIIRELSELLIKLSGKME